MIAIYFTATIIATIINKSSWFIKKKYQRLGSERTNSLVLKILKLTKENKWTSLQLTNPISLMKS